MLPIVLKTQIFLNAKIQKSSTTLTTANGSRKNHGIRGGHFLMNVHGFFVVAGMWNVLTAGLILKNRLVSARKITAKMTIQDLVLLVLRVKRSGAARATKQVRLILLTTMFLLFLVV